MSITGRREETVAHTPSTLVDGHSAGQSVGGGGVDDRTVGQRVGEGHAELDQVGAALGAGLGDGPRVLEVGVPPIR